METCAGHLHLPRRTVTATSPLPAETALSNNCRTKTARIALRNQIRANFVRFSEGEPGIWNTLLGAKRVDVSYWEWAVPKSSVSFAKRGRLQGLARRRQAHHRRATAPLAIVTYQDSEHRRKARQAWPHTPPRGSSGTKSPKMFRTKSSNWRRSTWTNRPANGPGSLLTRRVFTYFPLPLRRGFGLAYAGFAEWLVLRHLFGSQVNIN